MSVVPRPTTVDDREQLVALLTRVFALSRDAPFVNPALLAWKYWQPRADFAGPRSFVLEAGGTLVAHAGLWPMTVQLANGQTEHGVHVIDWASDAVGAGVRLLRWLMAEHDFVCGIGGSVAMQKLVPRLGFSVQTEALIWARPLRPWKQVVQHQSRNARLVPRLMRNVLWSAMPRRRRNPGWAAVRTTTAAAASVLAVSRERDQEFFAYLERCPVARLIPFVITYRAHAEGFFALSVAAAQAKVVGIWLNEPSTDHWRIAFELAQQAALRETNASELVARAAGRDTAAGAATAGMRLRGRARVYVYRRPASRGPVCAGFQICDNDSVFLVGDRPHFLT